MASIASLGVGSGIDVRGLVDQLLAAEGQPKALRYDRKEATLQAQISAMGTLKGALSDFQSSLSGLKYSSAFSKLNASSSQSSIFTASASAGAAAGSYSIEVSKLAEAHSVSTKAGSGIASLGDQIGTGTITFDFGTWDNTAVPPTFTANASKPSQSITITDGSIAGIRDAINEANIGVTANIVFDGTDYRLTMTSETGEASAMRITVADDDLTNTDASGLSQLAFDLDTGSASYAENLDQNTVGQDAEVSIDGLLIKNATNTLTNIIDDVTIDLHKADVGTVGTLSISQDTAGVKAALESFVESFNSLNATLEELTYFNVDSGERGIFLGDGSVRNIESSIRRVMSQAYGSTSDNFTTLASLGIRTQRDGNLEIDEDSLNSALSGDMDELRVLFAGGYKTPESALFDYIDVPSSIDAGSFAINVTQVATQGTYQADVLNNLNITAGNETFTLNVDGVTTGNIVITPNAYADGSALAAEIQTQLAADSVGKNVAVSYDATANKLLFTSKTYGSASSITVASSSGTLAADAGIGTAVGTSTTGVDVAGYFGDTVPTQGSYFGTALSTLTVSAGNNTFRLNVDGTESADITITAGTYATQAALVTEIQAQLDAGGVNATVSYNAGSNRLEFLSDSYGTTSSVSVTSSQGTLAADLGIDTSGGLSQDGQGIAATGSGRILTGTGDYSAVQVEYLGQFTNRYAAQEEQSGLMKDLSSMLDSFLLTGGIINAKTDSYNDQIDDINKQRESLDNRLASMELTLLKKFGAMDSLVAQLNSTSSYLQGQFAQLANLNKKS